MHTALVCDSDNVFREHLQATLLGLGFRTVLLCTSRDEALALAVEHLPQLAVLEAAAPIHGLTLAAALQSHLETVTLLTVSPGDQPLLKQATTHVIDAFLAKPALLPELTLSVELALLTAQRSAGLKTELQATQRALWERKQIEQAKGLLMLRERLTEEQAYRRMRSQAMARRISIAALAEELISLRRKTGEYPAGRACHD